MLNRAVARLPLFEKAEDYEAFERVLSESFERHPLPIYAYVVMSNHWHFVVRPESDEQLSEFFRWLTHTQTMRWHAHYGTQGTGRLYQGRFKTFPMGQDDHLICGTQPRAGAQIGNLVARIWGDTREGRRRRCAYCQRDDAFAD